MGHGEAFDDADFSVHAGEAAAAVVDAAGDYLEAQAGVGFDVEAEERRVEIGAKGIDVVEEQVTEVGAFLEEAEEDAVAEHVGNFKPMANGMHALEGEVVGVIGTFAARAGPADE